MDPATATAEQAAVRAGFGMGRLFLADSRLALAVMNQGRHLVLARVFGTSREQANLLTFVVALAAADVAYETARRAVRAPLGLTGTDAAMGGFLFREAAVGVFGPGSRDVPFRGGLLALALLGGIALPGLRRATSGARAAEQRIRHARISRYPGA